MTAPVADKVGFTLPICGRLRQHGHWADLMDAADDGAAIIEELYEAAAAAEFLLSALCVDRESETRKLLRAALAKVRGKAERDYRGPPRSEPDENPASGGEQ